MMVRLGHSTIMMSRFVSEGLKMFPEEEFDGEKTEKDPGTPVNFLGESRKWGKIVWMVLRCHFFWWGIMHRNFSSPSPVFLNW